MSQSKMGCHAMLVIELEIWEQFGLIFDVKEKVLLEIFYVN